MRLLKGRKIKAQKNICYQSKAMVLNLIKSFKHPLLPNQTLFYQKGRIESTYFSSFFLIFWGCGKQSEKIMAFLNTPFLDKQKRDNLSKNPYCLPNKIPVYFPCFLFNFDSKK